MTEIRFEKMRDDEGETAAGEGDREGRGGAQINISTLFERPIGAGSLCRRGPGPGEFRGK